MHINAAENFHYGSRDRTRSHWIHAFRVPPDFPRTFPARVRPLACAGSIIVLPQSAFFGE